MHRLSVSGERQSESPVCSSDRSDGGLGGSGKVEGWYLISSYVTHRGTSKDKIELGLYDGFTVQIYHLSIQLFKSFINSLITTALTRFIIVRR